MKFLSVRYVLFLSSLFVISAMTGMEAEKKQPNSQELRLYKKIHADDPFYRMYSMYLCIGKKIIGHAKITIKKKYNTAHLDVLEIKQEEREKSYGSFLLRAALHDVENAESCIHMKWSVVPLNLRDGEQEQEMLPRLIDFYKKHGAIVYRPNNMIHLFQRDEQKPKENFIISRL